MTRDLESALSRVTSSADEATAAEAVFAAMAEGYRFARGGGGDAFLVAGYGVEGRGSSRDAAFDPGLVRRRGSRHRIAERPRGDTELTDQIQIDFERFNRENPDVYRQFDRFARRMIEKGCAVGSAYLIFERIRWETVVETRGEPVKLNNNYRPLYARLWMERNPDHAGFFRTRVRRAHTSNGGLGSVEEMLA